MAERDPAAWHHDAAALAKGWTVPCEHCGQPVTEANSCAEMVAKAAGTERVVARKAWCDEDACAEDMMSGFSQPAEATGA
jgi:hypothetical protein